jgi:hypothetical protein
MKPSKPISKAQAIEKVTAEMNSPMGLDEFINQVLAIWPSNANRPSASVRQTIRDDYLGISQKDLTAEDFHLEDIHGRNIPVNPLTVEAKMDTIYGVQEFEKTVFDLGWWYKQHKLQRGDSLLVTILDWENGHFRIQPEPARVRQRHEEEIQQQNQALANHIFQLLETARYEYVWGNVAIPTAYLRIKDPYACPADHWYEILERDPRMNWTGYEIRYADWGSPFENIFSDPLSSSGQPASSRSKPITTEQATQVYRFKASLWHHKSLWRRIEIQGGQTLAEFDRILRSAFEHDTWDHLSGFWKLVRRGQSRRFREVDLGSINPFEGDEAGGIQVANLELKPGEALKYVYDFGDWIKHRIELEAISDPERDATYPCIVGQNKPRYHYCQSCKEAGRKEIATWICIDCSNHRQENFFICEACAEANHEDHYIDTILY